MVKPSSNLTNGQSSSRQQQSLDAVSLNNTDAEDLSFVVLNAQSMGPPSFNSNFMIPSLTTSENSVSLSLGVNGDEMNKKLQDIIRENAELKEALQQNNLAMKQQYTTLSTWHEEVLNVHQSHKAKFDEMKALIVKLKGEKEALLLKLPSQTKVEETLSENQELKCKLQVVEANLQERQQENEALKKQIAELEVKSRQGTVADVALERAERRVRELTEERKSILQEKEELQQRTCLLQQELATVQAEGFVLVDTDKEASPKVQKPLQSPQDKLNSFYSAVDKYDERMMESFKVLENQVTSFVAVYHWLDETRAKLPDSSAGLSELGTFLEMVSLSLREAQKSSNSRRLQMEEASQQLGRLGSEFQSLLQEFLSLSNELKSKSVLLPQATNDASTAEVEKKLLEVKDQLLETQGRLNLKEKLIGQLNAALEDKEAKLAQSLKLNDKKDQSKELKEQVDHMMAQILELKDLLEQKEGTIEKQKTSIAQKDSKMAQLELRVSQAETKFEQKEAEVLTTQKRLKTLEQSVDALQAQAEVYKMDFNEERESREKLAADKEKLADELLAVQKENQRLTTEVDAMKKQQTSIVSAPTSSASRNQSSHNYNTIAAPGRSKGHWLSDDGDQPKYECPKCFLVFKSLHPLENHVELCLDQDMFP